MSWDWNLPEEEKYETQYGKHNEASSKDAGRNAKNTEES